MKLSEAIKLFDLDSEEFYILAFETKDKMMMNSICFGDQNKMVLALAMQLEAEKDKALERIGFEYDKKEGFFDNNIKH